MTQPWNDEPIHSANDDSLNRRHLAYRAADLIHRTHSWESSVVFGLTGPWGSGKSSMAAMIDERLRARGDAWSIARFTPWSSSDVSGLLAEFFSVLDAALPSSKGAMAKSALRVCATVASPLLRLTPIVGGAASQGAQMVADRLAKPTPWDAAFRDAAEQLKKLGTPVLVIADDIDRLQVDELMALLKVVRLLGRFPGVHYLLVYDEQTLLNNLRVGGASGSGQDEPRLFMEKIVQYPLIVPPLLPAQILVRLDEGLTRIMAEAGRPLKREEPRLGNTLAAFQSQLSTPRSIDRFLAQVEHVVPMHLPDEIDDVDVILLVFVRMQFPRVWTALPRWRSRLTGQASIDDWVSGRDKQAVDWGPLLGLAVDASRADAQQVLEELFPVISKYKLGRTSKRSVSRPAYFNRYFANAIPEDDIADSEVAAALSAASDQGDGELLRNLLLSSYPGRADAALSKLREPLRSDSGNGPSAFVASLALIRVVAGLIMEIDDRSRAIFSLHDQAVHWLVDIVRHLRGDITSTAFLAALSECADTDLRVYIVWEVMRRYPDMSAADAIGEAALEMTAEAEGRVLAHLALMDDADLDDGRVMDLELISRHGNPEKFGSQVRAQFTTGVSVDDFAARCVTVSYLSSDASIRRLSSFRRDLFCAFMADDWTPAASYADAGTSEYDVGWANRRRFAAAAWISGDDVPD